MGKRKPTTEEIISNLREAETSQAKEVTKQYLQWTLLIPLRHDLDLLQTVRDHH